MRLSLLEGRTGEAPPPVRLTDINEARDRIYPEGAGLWEVSTRVLRDPVGRPEHEEDQLLDLGAIVDAKMLPGRRELVWIDDDELPWEVERVMHSLSSQKDAKTTAPWGAEGVPVLQEGNVYVLLRRRKQDISPDRTEASKERSGGS